MEARSYRKRPMVVKAVQWRGWSKDMEDFVGKNLVRLPIHHKHDSVRYCINTLEGHSYALSDGDWVIKGVKGEFYPCKPDVFAELYDILNEKEVTLDNDC
jgi:hypothetical protein